VAGYSAPVHKTSSKHEDILFKHCTAEISVVVCHWRASRGGLWDGKATASGAVKLNKSVQEGCERTARDERRP
jgi:hypothetical protein